MSMFPNSMFWAILPEAQKQIAAAAARLNFDARKPEGRVQVSRELPLVVAGDIAIVSIIGPMEKRTSWLGEALGFASTERARLAVEQAANDTDVSTIILRIDSPGGSVDGLDQLGDAVWKAKETKEVIAQVDGTMASAALYVGSQATRIHAGRTDIIGSIGTKMVVWDSSEMFNAAGIRVIPIDTGTYKSVGEPGTPVTDEQVEFLQSVVNAFYADFIGMVARGRNMTPEQVQQVADGRFWLAPEAQRLGLVDRIQTFDETVNEARHQRARRAANRRAMNNATMDLTRRTA